MTSILLSLQRVLPKPWLLGLYGAVAGLVGALMLGEGAWRLLRPPPPPAPTPAVYLAVSPTVSVFAGGKNRIAVKLVREHYDGAVALQVSGLPAGVTAAAVTVPAGGSEAEAEIPIEAAESATVGAAEVTVAGAGPEGGPRSKTEEKVAVSVLRPPAALRLSASPGVSVEQTGKNHFGVTIVRDHFAGPVELRLEGLPEEVVSPPVVMPAGESAAQVEVQAGAKAVAGAREVVLSAAGPAQGDQKGGPSARAQLKVTVLPFTPPPPPQVDVLFVLDVTGSMQAQIDGVREGIRGFADELEKKKLDARVGLVAYRDHLTESEEAEVLDFGGEVFTQDYDAFRRGVGRLKADGGGDTPESALDAVALAAGQPFRRQATRVLLLITDAPPHVPDKEMQTTGEVVEVLKKHRINQLHLVVRQENRRVYEQLQEGARGEFFDLNLVGRDRTAFASLLPRLSSSIARITVASVPPPPPPPASAPPPPLVAAAGTLAPAAAPPPPLKGVQSSEQFEAGSVWRLLAAISTWTGVAAGLIGLGLFLGQYFYLRQRLLPPLLALRGLAGGLAAGLVGGAAGQLLFQAAPVSGLAEALFRLLGWALLGSLVGLGMAFFTPNLRWDKGLLGGAVGGAAGALGFLAVSLALGGSPAGDLAARLLGAAVLGLCLGLMVALAEQVFRRAWLEVRYGASETRTVSLGPEPVSIGSDSRCSMIYAPRAAPQAYRYWFRDGKVECVDAATGQVAELRPGQEQTVGAVVVVVRTAETEDEGPSAPPPPLRPAASAPAPARPGPPAAAQPAARPAARGAAPVAPPPSGRSTPAGGQPQSSANGCPGCGRPAAGPVGKRYCVVCDRSF